MNGNHAAVPLEYPEDRRRPASSWPGVLVTSVILTALVTTVVLVVGAWFYRPLLEYLPWTLLPLSAPVVGTVIAERRRTVEAEENLVPVSVRRPARGRRGGWGRWRTYRAVGSPGLLICRSRKVPEDLELDVTGLGAPRRAPLHTRLLVTEGPAEVLMLATPHGPAELRGRPEHLHDLATRVTTPRRAPRSAGT